MRAKSTTEAQRHGERPGQWFQDAWNIIRAMLREIFDESAYDRFLLRTNAGRSIASYRAFTRERDASMLKKPRCC